MKTLLVTIFALCGILPIRPGGVQYLDPTGTYILKGTKSAGRIVGHSGEIRVRLLNTRKIALSFYISKGYPDYAFGSFTDTLVYEENAASYQPANDNDCHILFVFGPTKAEIEQLYRDPHCTCGFGKDVLISASFRKYSSDPPVIQDLSHHGSE